MENKIQELIEEISKLISQDHPNTRLKSLMFEYENEDLNQESNNIGRIEQQVERPNINSNWCCVERNQSGNCIKRVRC